MRALLLALTASVLGAPGAQAGDVWLDFQGGFQHHPVYQDGGALDIGKQLALGVDVEVPLGEHLALRAQMADVTTGGGLTFHGARQDLDLDLLDTAVLLKASVHFGYGDQLYVLAGPALGVRTNTPHTLFGPVTSNPVPYPLEVAEGWRRVTVSAVIGAGFAIRPRGGRVGTFFEAQYRRGLNDLYAAPDPSPFAYDPVDRSHGWRFVTGLSIAVR